MRDQTRLRLNATNPVYARLDKRNVDLSRSTGLRAKQKRASVYFMTDSLRQPFGTLHRLPLHFHTLSRLRPNWILLLRIEPAAISTSLAFF
jgi:hypothetical protein